MKVGGNFTRRANCHRVANMLSRQLKAFYFAAMRLPMMVSGLLYKTFRAPTHGVVRVQLGPGQKNYLPGWINVDANIVTARCDVWANLEDPLPFRDETVDVFYSHHVVEHLPDRLLVCHFKELYRCLRPGGMFRVGGPHGHSAIKKYVEEDPSWFGDFPDRHESIGGKLVNFVFCRNEHLTLLTPSYLQEITQEVGFERLAVCEPTKTTTNPALIDQCVLDTEWESTPDVPHTLIIEGYKPVYGQDGKRTSAP
jgi:predicted SAM-dependent methyltransferase